MKEAIGTSMVFNLIMIFLGVFIILYVSSIAYSKGFKVRNRLIDIIEKYDGYTEEAKNEIAENLAAIGYRIVDSKCGDHNGVEPIADDSAYHYCIYQYNTNKGNYYGVQVFIHFDFPIIGGFFEIPIYGETRILFEKSEVQG